MDLGASRRQIWTQIVTRPPPEPATVRARTAACRWWTARLVVVQTALMGEGDDPRDVSRILQAAGDGGRVDMDALLPLVYDGLYAIASRRMSGERVGHTLQATALVNETFVRLVGRDDLAWESKAHFYGAAAEAMRLILIDHARTKGRKKRGGGRRRLPLDVVDLAVENDVEQILSVDEAVQRLTEQDPRMGAIVKLRFYAGLSDTETALALGITARTVRRDWVLARAWLQRHLSEE
jgi:RNA polymerase sigma factor (TIGR02999 family)